MSAKLKPGDEVRVVAPSRGWLPKRARMYERAQTVLEEIGFTVTYGKNIRSLERFETASVTDRLADLNDAYRDPSVKAVITLDGGWLANALLPCIDWQLIRNNPKPLMGFSDITVLVNALYAKTGAVQYLGPTFLELGQKGQAYTIESFKRTLTDNKTIELARSRRWQRGKKQVATRPWQALQAGTCQGVLLGGNLGSFYLLQGTPYQPRFDRPVVLAVEDDAEAGKYAAREFDRRLESLLQLPGVRENLQGLLIGRFEPKSNVTLSDIAYTVKRLELRDIPVIAGMDFGHTKPMLTLPIGGIIQVRAERTKAQVVLLNY
jgi:muramoyltetrapeptide carboxypeptidase